jgi:hypothetical protein
MNLYEIISKIQKDLTCPICKKNYEIGEIRLRALLDHTLIIQTICEENHIALILTNYNEKPHTKITNQEVETLHNKLINFDGDFSKIWKN